MQGTILGSDRNRIRHAATSGSRRRSHSGQALVEFAMVGVLLLTLSLGVVEFGRAFAASMAVTHASRDAARLAMNPDATDAEVIAAANSAAGSHELTDVALDRSTVVGETSTITVTYEYDAIFPLVANLWGGGPLTISESTVSRVGWQ